MKNYKIPNIKDIDLDNLPIGQTLKCEFVGTQVVDGSQFLPGYDFDKKCSTIKRIRENYNK